MHARFSLYPLSAIAGLALLLAGCQSGTDHGHKSHAEGNAKDHSHKAGQPHGNSHTHSAKPGKTDGQTAAPKASVLFEVPMNQATVYEDVFVRFLVSGKTIAKAGEKVEDENYGHHHLIVDGAFIPSGKAVPTNATHIHYGQGQTEAYVKLAPGKHSLTMQLANGAHISFGEKLSHTINVEVKKTPEKLGVFFDGLTDGAKVKSPVALKFGLHGMTIRPAGEDPKDQISGHHHVIVDGAPVPRGDVVPSDAQHIHFGKGQTETKMDLKPGKHTLTLQFADGAHRSYGKQMSQTISIEVLP